MEERRVRRPVLLSPITPPSSQSPGRSRPRVGVLQSPSAEGPFPQLQPALSLATSSVPDQMWDRQSSKQSDCLAPGQCPPPVAFVDADGDTNRFEVGTFGLVYTPPATGGTGCATATGVGVSVLPPAAVASHACERLDYDHVARNLTAAGWQIPIPEDSRASVLGQLADLANAAGVPHNLGQNRCSVSERASSVRSSMQGTPFLSRLHMDKSMRTESVSPSMASPGAKPIWRLGRKLGSGAFGSVYQLLDERTGCQYAAKCLAHSNGADCSTREHLIKSFEREVEMLRELDHENIVRYFDFIRREDGCYIILEFMVGGSISDLIAQLGGPLRELHAAGIIAQAVVGLGYLHGKGIIHRDIKAGNLLTDQLGNVKLADFGCASTERVCAGEHGVGTVPFMAPEILSSQKYSYASDIWAVGATLVELLTGAAPFTELRDQAEDIMRYLRLVRDALLAGTTPAKYATSASTAASGFLGCCFKMEPSDRPGCDDLLMDPFLLLPDTDSERDPTETTACGLSPIFRRAVEARKQSMFPVHTQSSCASGWTSAPSSMLPPE